MTAKFQFVELILRAHFYTDETRMCAHLRPRSRRVAAVGLRNASLRLGVRDRTPRTPECPGCLRHCVSSKGLHPLHCESGYSHNVKGVTTK